MEITNKTQLLEFIRKQSLKLLSENQAFANLEHKLESVDESFVQVYEKKLERLKAEEEKAMESENYVELQKIKEEKLVALKRLIDSYKYKTKILEQIHDGLHHELADLGVKGSGVFRNKELNEFNNENFQKGQTIKLTTASSEITLEKISDVNQYKILNTNLEFLKPGDIIAIPNTKVGNSAKITVYRRPGENQKFQEIGTPTLQNIKSITKNPA